MKEFSPKSVCLFWGSGPSRAKQEIVPAYTLKRDDCRNIAQTEAIETQIEKAKEILASCPVKQIGIEGVEAPDAIAYISKTLQRPKLIVASSKDYFQILREDLQVYHPQKELLISEYEASALLGFSAKHFVLWKCIVGDSSKGIKGIPGVGKVKARRLIQTVIKTGRKFPLRPSEQKFLDRNKYIFTLGALLSKDEKTKILELYQSERKKKALGKFDGDTFSTFGSLLQGIFYYHSKNNNHNQNYSIGGTTLQ